jgi:hypothetical protein
MSSQCFYLHATIRALGAMADIWLSETFTISAYCSGVN